MEQAIILAGGRGERLRPLTADRPKCMVEILGSPVMGYQLRWLRASGVRHVAVACGYLHEVIESYFGDGSQYDLKIDYVLEDTPLGRGGAIKKAWMSTFATAKTVLCLNGDNICNLKIADLEEFHLQHNPYATVVTAPLRSPYGIVETDATDTITGFTEKPELPYGVNAGIYVMDNRIIERLPDVGDHEVQTFPKLAADGLLKAYKSKAFWRTVDTVKDVNELKQELETVLLGALLQSPH